MALAGHEAAAQDLGPRWTHFDVGAGYAAGSIVSGEDVAAFSADLGLSHPLARGLRASFEVGYCFLGAQGPGVSIPEIQVTTDPSHIVTALIGLELYGPVRGGSGPFVSEAFGLGAIMPGASHVKTTFTGDYDSPGKFEMRPAISLAAGFRHLPKQGGLAPRVSVRYLLLPSDQENAHTVSLSLGLGF